MVERRIEIVLGITQNDSKEMLIIQRKKAESGTGGVKLLWAFPGGKREQGESKEETAERELLEETGYKVKAGAVISERQHPQFPVYVYYLECTLVENVPMAQPSDDEIEKVEWVQARKLKKYFTTDLDPKVAKHLGIL